jgi:aminoglycoside phosphotransferase (APT) family kinase protein
MAALRRRQRRQDQPDADPAAGLDLDAVADAVSAVAGVALASGPEPVLAGSWPDAYTLTLDTDDPPWDGTLVARVCSPAVAAHEAGWISALGEAGFPVPEVVISAPDQGVLAFRATAGVNLAGCMVDDLMALPKFLAAFGQLHARLHALPVEGPDGLEGVADGVDPLVELYERAGTDAVRAALSAELAWLNTNRPTGGTAVPCHGDFNPVHVYIEDGDTSTAVPVNWTRARLAEPAYDVAATVTAFWTSPLYVESAMQRTALKMVRDSLIGAYRKAYDEAVAVPLDDEVVDYWQAYHLVWLAAGVVRRIQDEPVSPWDSAANAHRPESALDDLRDRFQELTEA